MKKWLLALGLLLVVGAAGAWYFGREGKSATTFRTAAVRRGDLVSAIAATGTVEPEELIDVGAQVAGQILTFGKDKNGKSIDYGSQVGENMVLAQIDDTIYQADVAQNTAQLQEAKAGVKRAEADLVQMRAKLFQAQRDWERAQNLGASDALAQASYDAYQATFEQAQANVSIAEAAIIQAKANVDQAEGTLQRAKRNLAYTTIKSPVDGVIIDRRVNIGQTVVASLNAPSLFLIAKDLRRMQVWVAVNEADIGNLHPGQPVTFIVDAFPGEVFRGQVNKVRLNAAMTQNVVTYTVEVTTDNSNGKLLPYLTANVQFETARKDDVMMVPNAALRWKPRTDLVAPDAREAYAKQQDGDGASRAGAPGGGGDRSRFAGGGGGGPGGATTTVSAERPTSRPLRRGGEGRRGGETRPGTLWVKDGQFVRPLAVRVGTTNDTDTEVQGEGVKEGLEIVLGEAVADTAATTGTNPFAPNMRRNGPRGGGGGGGGGGRRG